MTGRHWVICDRCGFKVRGGDARKEWNGLLVCRTGCWERRHPGDREIVVSDDQVVRNARPRPPDVFVEPGDVTEEDL